jgi:hypothetical protein
LAQFAAAGSVLSSVEPSSGAVRDQTEAAVIEISWPAERLANLATTPNYMCYIATLPHHWLLMEDAMCWEIDYKFLAEQKKAQETRIKQERRAGLIDGLLNQANTQSEKTAEETPVKEAAPAK